MGFFSNLLFGTGAPSSNNRRPTTGFHSLEDGYDDYYETTYDEAMSGDESCIEEMREEFGDDWESEY